MATKKKSAEQKKREAFLKRSKAAKKGWKTRRKNVQKKRIETNRKKLKNAQLSLPKKKRTNPSISKKDKALHELKKINKELEDKIKILEQTKDWVDAMPIEYISREGHVTVQPSRARHDPDFYIMYERLENARNISIDAFDNEAYDIAREYEYEVREIYTMFFSS